MSRGRSDSPWPSRSTVITRLPRAARSSASGRCISCESSSPWTRISGRAARRRALRGPPARARRGRPPPGRRRIRCRRCCCPWKRKEDIAQSAYTRARAAPWIARARCFPLRWPSFRWPAGDRPADDLLYEPASHAEGALLERGALGLVETDHQEEIHGQAAPHPRRTDRRDHRRRARYRPCDRAGVPAPGHEGGDRRRRPRRRPSRPRERARSASTVALAARRDRPRVVLGVPRRRRSSSSARSTCSSTTPGSCRSGASSTRTT